MDIFQDINNSNDDVLRCIFEFVGPGSYRYTGRVNRRFRTIYLAVQSECTCFQNAVASVACATIWIDEDDERARDEICRQAAKYGSLEVLQWARDKGYPWNGALIWLVAARHGHLEVLQWAWANGFPCDADKHVPSVHGQPLALAHCRTSK